MIKKTAVLQWLFVPLSAAAIQASILSWAPLAADPSREAMAVLLLAQFSGLVVLAAWCVELLGRTPNRTGQTTLGFAVAVVVGAAVGAFLLPATMESLDFTTLLAWHTLQVLPLWSLAVVRRKLTPVHVAGLDILVPGIAFLLAPMLFEGFYDHPESGRRYLDWALSVSAWPQACIEHLQIDLFKLERFYREFQIGERIYHYPESADAGRLQALMALCILVAGLILGLFKRLLGRLWTPEARFADNGA